MRILKDIILYVIDIMLLTDTSYESMQANDISPENLRKIFEIEQDMWARGIGEYVYCNSCDEIFSKEDIYGENGSVKIPRDIQKDTVMRIEKQLGGGCPNCPNCGEKTDHVYSQEAYIPDIENRLNREGSFLSVSRNEQGDITGFMDGYIATLEEIFEEEFKFHFSNSLIAEIIEKYHINKKQKLLTFSSLGTDDRNKSLLTIFGLLKNFFENMHEKYDDVASIFESIRGSSTYCIFSIMGANKMRVYERGDLLIPANINPNFQTDILFQQGVVRKYKKKFNIRTRDVLFYSKSLEMEGVHL